MTDLGGVENQVNKAKEQRGDEAGASTRQHAIVLSVILISMDDGIQRLRPNIVEI